MTVVTHDEKKLTYDLLLSLVYGQSDRWWEYISMHVCIGGQITKSINKFNYTQNRKSTKKRRRQSRRRKLSFYSSLTIDINHRWLIVNRKSYFWIFFFILFSFLFFVVVLFRLLLSLVIRSQWQEMTSSDFACAHYFSVVQEILCRQCVQACI